MTGSIKTAAQFWRLLSYRDDTPTERAFVDGILHTLTMLADPDYDLELPIAEQVEQIAQRIDTRRAARGQARVAP